MQASISKKLVHFFHVVHKGLVFGIETAIITFPFLGNWNVYYELFHETLLKQNFTAGHYEICFRE